MAPLAKISTLALALAGGASALRGVRNGHRVARGLTEATVDNPCANGLEGEWTYRFPAGEVPSNRRCYTKLIVCYGSQFIAQVSSGHVRSGARALRWRAHWLRDELDGHGRARLQR